MMKLSAITALRLGSVGVFTNPRQRRTRAAEARRWAGRSSAFLRDGGPPPANTAPTEPWRDPVAPTLTPKLPEPEHVAEQPADEGDTAGDDMGASNSAISPVAVAGLSAAVTAAVIGSLAGRVSDGGWAIASLLTLVALTASFLAGRAVLAPSGVSVASGEPEARRPVYSVPKTNVRPPSTRLSWRDKTRSALVEALPSRRTDPQARGAGQSEPSRGSAAEDVRGMRASGGEAERLRRHIRIRPRHRAVTVVTEQGVRHDAEIIDLSQSGVALEGTMPGVWIGSMVTVGSRRAKAVRMIPRGMALEFSVPIPERSLHANTVL